MEKLNVAIADDNERVVELLDRIVSSDEELNVVGKAGNGEELYDIIKTKEPDVVLLDIIMPKVDGLTVMERVNADKSMKKHPAFIVITAVGQEKITEDAFALGANYYILKPFDNDKIKAIPIIPILEAKAVNKVLPFLVLMLLKDSFKAVLKFIAVFLIFKIEVSFSFSVTGLESLILVPSLNSIILVA